LAAGIAAMAQEAKSMVQSAGVAALAEGSDGAVAVEAGVIKAGLGGMLNIKSTEIKVTAPTAADPKTICKKAMIGKGRLADHEFIFVMDGSKADGDLETLKVIAVASKDFVEARLNKVAPDIYMQEGMIVLPGTDLAGEGLMCNLKAPNGKIICSKLIKVLQAKCEMAGKTRNVIVIDMNHNGKLDDPWTCPRDKDGFLLFNSNKMKMGDIAIIDGISVMLGMPFVLDGALWELAIADGKIAVKKQVVQMGTIAWKGENDPEALIILEGKQMVLQLQKPEKNSWVLPVGSYRMMALAYNQGKSRVMIQREKGLLLAVPAATPLELSPETEVVANLKTSSLDRQRNLRLSLAMTTPDGGQVMVTTETESGNEPKGLGFRILDAAGKEVHKGTFEFG
jgi:hypothetical protein